MTEELDKEAEEYAKHVRYTKTQWNCHEIFDEDLENAYIAGAKAREKHIAELEEEAKGIIKDMLRDIPNRMWYTDNVIKRAEDFIKEA